MKRIILSLLVIVALVSCAPPVAALRSTATLPSTGGDESSRVRALETAPATGGLSLPLVDDGLLECDTTATANDLLEAARGMFLADNYALAELLYKCLLRHEPNNLSALMELSIVYETTGELQLAKGLLSRAAILRPYDQEIVDRNAEVAKKLVTALLADVESLFARQDYEAALPKLSVLLNTQPDNPEFHYKKAQAHLKLGDAESALSEAEKAILLQKDARYFAIRTDALTLTQSRDIDELIRDAKALVAAGRFQDRDRALALMSQILARDPRNRWAKKQFLVLTNGEEQTAQVEVTEPGEETLFTRAAEKIRPAADRVAAVGLAFGRRLLDGIGRHLELFLAAFIVFIVLFSPLTSTILRGFDPRQPLSGRLDQFNIHEVFSLIHSQARSGVLRVRAGRVWGRVYFTNGEICHCTSGNVEGTDAVRLLLDEAKEGHFVLTRLPHAFKQTIDAPFSLVLMGIGEESFLRASGPRVELSRDSSPTKSKIKSMLENKS